MSDRINALTVVIDRGTSEDDARAIINAISMIKGVSVVSKHVADSMSHIAYSHARSDLQQRVWEALYDTSKDEKIAR